MIQQAVQFAPECGSCHRVCEGWIVQLVADNKLRWEVEQACDACGIIVEDGAWGAAPECVRQPLLSKYGQGFVRIEGLIDYGGKLLKVFREIFGQSIKEAKSSAQELGGVGWRGTKVESSFVAEALKAAGVDAEEGEVHDI